MEEKGNVKISLAGFFLILAIIAIVIMGFFMYKIYTDKQKSDEKVENLNSEVSRLQGTINSIQSTINSTNTSNNNIVTNSSENNTVNTNVGTDSNNEQNNVENNKTIQNDNSKNIIMYEHTNIANFKSNIYGISGGPSKKYEDYYNTTYDVYQNGQKIGQTKGSVTKGESFDGISYYIEYEKEDYESAKSKVFVSCNYNVVPRKYEDVNEIPSAIKSEFPGYDSLKMQSIDLDGDGKKEYVLAYSMTNNKSGVYLYDSNYKKISMLATLDSKYLSDFSNIIFMDIDNDSNMEIIINIPVATSFFRFGVYKYENNVVTGPIDNFSMAA